MKYLIFALIFIRTVIEGYAQHNGQNTELKALSRDFNSTSTSEGITYQENADFAIIRDTLVIHCAKWIKGETEKNEFVYLLPVKSIGDIELKSTDTEGTSITMISITCNSGLPDFIFKYGSVALVREEMAGGVSEDDMTVYVTVTLPVIADMTKYERLRDVLASLK